MLFRTADFAALHAERLVVDGGQEIIHLQRILNFNFLCRLTDFPFSTGLNIKTVPCCLTSHTICQDRIGLVFFFGTLATR